MQLLWILGFDATWKLRSLNMSQPDYYVSMIKALAAGNYLRVVKRVSRSESRIYETVRHDSRVELVVSTDLGTSSRNNDWVIYNEYHSDGHVKKIIRLVSAIAPEILIFAQFVYWWDAEFLPKGHIQDGLVKVIANMTGKIEDFVRGAMPAYTRH